MLYRTAGIRASGTRAYRLAYPDTVAHLESTAKFPNLQEVRRVVEAHSQPIYSGDKAALFIHQEHLPDDLIAPLQDLEAFHRSCELLAFTPDIYELHLGRGFPTEKNISRASFIPCTGFPVTFPVAHVDPYNALSFGVEELERFLGNFFGSAGKVIFLALKDNDGRYYSPEDYQPIIERAMGYLGTPIVSREVH